MGLPDVLDPQQDFGLPYTNYADVADPETEVDASAYERLCIGAAGMSHTAAKAWVVVSAAATAAGRVRHHDAMWGSTESVKPAITTTAVNIFTVTWATSYPDLNPTVARQATASVNLRAVQLTLLAEGRGWATVSGNTATITTKTAAGTAAAIAFSLSVY